MMRAWTIEEQTRLHELGMICDRRRRDMHDAELALQPNVTAETAAAFCDAVQRLISAEVKYNCYETGLDL